MVNDGWSLSRGLQRRRRGQRKRLRRCQRERHRHRRRPRHPGMCPLLQSTGSPLLQSTGGRRGSRWRSLRGVMLRPSTAPASTAAASQAASAMVALPSRGTPTRTGPQGNIRHCAQPATRNTASATIAAAWLGSHHGYGATEQLWRDTKQKLIAQALPQASGSLVVPRKHPCPLELRGASVSGFVRRGRPFLSPRSSCHSGLVGHALADTYRF